MKKIFTLIAMTILAAGGVNAEKKTIWEGSVTFDESWSGSFTVDKSEFNGIKAGDKLIITAKPETATNWQYGAQVFLKTRRAGWANIAATVSVPEAKTYTVEITDESLSIESSGQTISTTMIKELTEQGLAVQGIIATVTKLELETAVNYGDGTNIEFDQYGNITSDKFAGYSDQAKVEFVISATGEATNADGSIIGWGIGKIESLDGSVKVADLGLKKIGDNVYAFTVADLKAALEAPKNQYNMQGIAFSVWNQGNATCTRKSVTIYEVSTATGIDAVKPNVQKQDGVRYNLAGQKVADSYKGIVIMNGRKMIVK